MSGIECAFFGALGRDAERKTSQAGRSYLRLNIHVGDGDSVQWVSVVAFDEHALEAAVDPAMVAIREGLAIALTVPGNERGSSTLDIATDA